MIMRIKLLYRIKWIARIAALVFFVVCAVAQGQMKQFPPQYSSEDVSSPIILTTADNTLLAFWYSGTKIFISRSSNNGTNWSQPILIVNISAWNIYLTGLITKSGRILIAYGGSNYNYGSSIIYSDDNGLTWSNPTYFYYSNYALGGHLFQSASGKIFYTYTQYSNSVTNIYLSSSIDNGNTFTNGSTLYTGPSYGSITSLNNNNLMMVYSSNGFVSVLSTDDGSHWGNKVVIDTDNTSVYNPKLIKDTSGVIWLFYQKNMPSIFSGITQSDIFYRQSTDNGTTWSLPNHFTKFPGFDGSYNLSVKGNNPLVSFASDRFNSIKGFWYGFAGITNDSLTPPYLYKTSMSVQQPIPGKPFNISAYVDGISNITTVSITELLNETVSSPIAMYDDGTHGDTTAGDKIYSCTVPGINTGDILQTTINISDQASNSASYNGITTSIPYNNGIDSVMIDVNRFKLPVGNNGILASVLYSNKYWGLGTYDGNTTLFDGGFLLSGKSNGSLWSNGVTNCVRVLDYVPGKVGSVSNDPKNILYVVRSTDPPFGESWQNWKIAVSQGADFYDGNHDGIYNPVDLNGNGKWDPNEDRPDLLGDMTAWCVYNDGLPSIQRVYSDVSPQGIEVQQTVFAQKDSADLNNVVFIRYRFINRGTVADVLDSVYFGSTNDADIGDNGSNDLDGCDTLINTGFTYHHVGAGDTKWGNTPPAELITLLQGPTSYIPGVTFTDINGNGIYDPGIDIPLDTAFGLKGPLIGMSEYPGAKNLNISSFIQYYGGIDPDNKFQILYYLLGKDRNGNNIDPCNWGQGKMFGGVNCSSVNPAFMYSGDPIAQTGWINVIPQDQRMIVSTGPFKLEKNKPVDIIVAYIVGRGADELNSLSIAENYAINTIKYYNSNFPKSILTGIKDLSITVTDFKLYQNYPNPFNPATRIRYSIRTKSLVTLKIYNILGEEAAVLLNEEKNPGEYELIFNAAKYNLASGVYFYRLTAGGFNSVKKMVLIK